MSILNIISLSVKSGFVATAIFTLLIFISPLLGAPRIPIGELLAKAAGVPNIVGWIMHFIVGIIFAGVYILIFKFLPGSVIWKGVIFSFIPFILAQLASFATSGFDFSDPDRIVLLIGSLVGHLVYGIALSISVNLLTT